MKIEISRAIDIYESPDGKQLIALYGSKINIFAKEGLVKLHEFKDIKNPAYVTFAPNRNIFVVKNTSGHIAVFSLETLECIAKNKLTENEGSAMVFDQSGRNVICCDWNGYIHVYNIDENKYSVEHIVDKSTYGMIRGIKKINNNYWFFFGKGIVKWEFPFSNTAINKEVLSRKDVFYESFMPKCNTKNGEIIIIKKYEERIIFYDINTIKCTKQISTNKTIAYMDWSTDRKYIVIVYNCFDTPYIPTYKYDVSKEITLDKHEGNVILFRANDGKIMADLNIEYPRIAKFSNDLKNIYIGTYKNILMFNTDEFFALQ